jgi:hypothetical protein
MLCSCPVPCRLLHAMASWRLCCAMRVCCDKVAQPHAAACPPCCCSASLPRSLWPFLPHRAHVSTTCALYIPRAMFLATARHVYFTPC